VVVLAGIIGSNNNNY
jgi:hypothetical protein